MLWPTIHIYVCMEEHSVLNTVSNDYFFSALKYVNFTVTWTESHWARMSFDLHVYS